MTDNSSRRNFLQMLGMSAGASLIGKSALAAFTNTEEIKKLNPQQQEFMMRYGKWMDEFIDVIRVQKDSPDDLENHKKMIALTERSEQLQPELTEHMKDETFSLIYNLSIERMTKEI